MIAAFATLLSPGSAHDARAQTVAGRLLDGRTREPIILAVVTLVDTATTLVDRTYTNEKGEFVLRAPAPGAYYVAAARTGYSPVLDGVLELGAGGEISVDVYMRPEAIQLDPILVEGRRERTERHLASSGFYDRSDQGFGYFITPEKINRRPLSGFEDLFRVGNVPGVVAAAGPFGTSVCINRPGPGAGGGGGSGNTCEPPYCDPVVYVDGAQIQVMGGIEQALDVNDVAGVEVYTRASSTPLMWGGTGSACGVVVFWTRK